MAIRSISREEFDGFKPFRAASAEPTAEEKEWFTDENTTVLGVIAHVGADDSWLVVVMGRDSWGRFRDIDVETDLRSLVEAREEVKDTMEHHIATGNRIFE